MKMTHLSPNLFILVKVRFVKGLSLALDFTIAQTLAATCLVIVIMSENTNL